MRLIAGGLFAAFSCLSIPFPACAAQSAPDKQPVPAVQPDTVSADKMPLAKILAPEPDRTVPFVMPTEERIVMTTGEVKIRKFSQTFTDAIVGASEVADVVPLSDQRIMITAKKEGFTSILALDEKKNIVAGFQIEVTHIVHAGRTDMVVHYLELGQGFSSEYQCDPRSSHVCSFIRNNKGSAKQGGGADAQLPPIAQTPEQSVFPQ